MEAKTFSISLHLYLQANGGLENINKDRKVTFIMREVGMHMSLRGVNGYNSPVGCEVTNIEYKDGYYWGTTEEGKRICNELDIPTIELPLAFLMEPREKQGDENIQCELIGRTFGEAINFAKYSRAIKRPEFSHWWRMDLNSIGGFTQTDREATDWMISQEYSYIKKYN